MFELELEEYTKEGVDTINISYVDNSPLLELHLAKPMGLYALLDEEAMFPNASDDTLGSSLPVPVACFVCVCFFCALCILSLSVCTVCV